MIVSSVLDTSAVLAYIQHENGYELVEKALDEKAGICAANLAEVTSVLVRNGDTIEEARKDIKDLGLTVFAVDETLAFAAAALIKITKPQGLSMGDRLCLALAAQLRVPAVTADKPWAKIAMEADVEVRLIR